MKTYDLSKITTFEFTILRDSIQNSNTEIGKGEFNLRSGERKNSIYFKKEGYKKYFLVQKDNEYYFSDSGIPNSCVLELLKQRCGYFCKHKSRSIYLDNLKFKPESLYMADLYEEFDLTKNNVILNMSNKMTAYINPNNYTAIIFPTN